MHIFSGLMKRFRTDQRGNIAVIFGIAVIPIISAVGVAVDYSEASRMKAKLQSAADAAAVASISQNSQGWLAASQMTGNGAVTTAQTDAMNIFYGNVYTVYKQAASNNLFSLNTSLTNATVTKTGAGLTSTVKFNATVPTTFMNVVGFNSLVVQGSSSASASLPLYLDFYVALDVSGSMGLPSTTTPNGGDAKRMQTINPDNWVQYRTGCTLACHFAPQKSACVDPPVTAPAAPPPNPATTVTSYTQQYNTNNYCMGYIYSRVSQSALSTLLNATPSQLGGSGPPVPKQVPGLPVAMLPTLNNSMTGPNSFITGNSASTTWSLPAVTSCPTAGTDACIQLRLDAVGVALNATQAVNGIDGLFATAVNPQYMQVPQQFRIGLYPFITKMDTNYAPLTSTINANPNTPGTINYQAQNLAQELDTNMNTALGSGGTHIDVGLNSLNTLITSVGTGSNSNNTLPYIFLITDGAQDPQSKGVPNGNWSGSNHAVTLGDISNQFPNICTTIKGRGIVISVLYIPYQTINPVNASFANDEDDFANNNINGPPGISTALTNCASPGFMYTANTPGDITTSLQAMFKHALMTAHLTN
jgi:Flp pilus assembly protein TadG